MNESLTECGLRGTGRTTRMLHRAMEEAEKGRNVLVVAAHNNHATMLAGMIRNLMRSPNVALPNVVVLGHLDVNWETMQVRNVAEGTCVLFDHFTLESGLAKMLAAVHEFDMAEGDVNVVVAGQVRQRVPGPAWNGNTVPFWKGSTVPFMVIGKSWLENGTWIVQDIVGGLKIMSEGGIRECGFQQATVTTEL